MSRPLVRVAWAISALGFLAFAVYGSLVPFNFDFTRDALAPMKPSLSWSGSDWGVNVCLFIPIGFCLLGAISPSRASLVQTGLSIIFVLIFCCSSTLVMEFAQNLLPGRVASLSDVLAQCVGSAIGLIVWLMFGTVATGWLDSYLTDRASRLTRLLQAYVVGLALYSLMPLDVNFQPLGVYQKFKSGRVRLIPEFSHDKFFEEAYETVTNAALFVPVGAWAVLAVRRNRDPPTYIRSLLFGFNVVFGIELAQLFVASRVTDSRDLITGMVGVLIGSGLSHRWRQAEAEGTAAATGFGWIWFWIGCCYGMMLIVPFWNPFDFTQDIEVISRRTETFFSSVPLLAAIQGDRFLGVSAILRKVTFFIPLGFFAVFATRNQPRSVARFTLLMLMFWIALFGLALEAGRILIPSRTAEIGNILLYVGGASAGVWVASRLRPTP